MANLSPGITLVVAAGGLFSVIFAIFAVNKYLRPYLQHGDRKPVPTLPQVEERKHDAELRRSLYGGPNLMYNFEDPRNDISDYDLKNTRFSTNALDFSRPSSRSASPYGKRSRSQSRSRSLHELQASLYSEPGLLENDARSSFHNLVLDQPDVITSSKPSTPRTRSLYNSGNSTPRPRSLFAETGVGSTISTPYPSSLYNVSQPPTPRARSLRASTGVINSNSKSLPYANQNLEMAQRISANLRKSLEVERKAVNARQSRADTNPFATPFADDPSIDLGYFGPNPAEEHKHKRSRSAPNIKDRIVLNAAVDVIPVRANMLPIPGSEHLVPPRRPKLPTPGSGATLIAVPNVSTPMNTGRKRTSMDEKVPVVTPTEERSQAESHSVAEWQMPVQTPNTFSPAPEDVEYGEWPLPSRPTNFEPVSQSLSKSNAVEYIYDGRKLRPISDDIVQRTPVDLQTSSPVPLRPRTWDVEQLGYDDQVKRPVLTSIARAYPLSQRIVSAMARPAYGPSRSPVRQREGDLESGRGRPNLRRVVSDLIYTEDVV